MLPESRLASAATTEPPAALLPFSPAGPDANGHALETASAPLRQAIFRTQQWLLNQQQADGLLGRRIGGDTILESEFLLLLAYLGEERTPLAKNARTTCCKSKPPLAGGHNTPAARSTLAPA